MLSTGEFARRAGVTPRTLRYYDRLGLLRRYRALDDDTQAWMDVVLSAYQAGD